MLLALTSARAAASSPVLSGLSEPTEPAVTQNGILYFAQLLDANTVTVSQLDPGSSSPVEVYRLIGTQPYLNDIHPMPNGDIVFITAVATTPDGSTRQWALVQLDPTTGKATQLAVTTGSPSGTSGPGLASGTAIDLDGVAGDGTVYFAEHSIDPKTGNQVADLLALDPGSTTPREVEHLAGSTGSDEIGWLTVAPTGAAYFEDDGTAYEASGKSVHVLVSNVGGAGLGFDAAGNLYLLDRTFVDETGFGCATSTTFDILRFTPEQLATTSPTPTMVSQATYPGFVAVWIGSSSVFQVAGAGDVYWVASPIACGGQDQVDEVIHVPASNGQQTVIYQAKPQTGSSAAEGPLEMAATTTGTVYLTATAAGQVVELGPPPPKPGTTTDVAPVSGVVTVNGVPLTTARQIRFGSVIDATRGTLAATTAVGHTTQTAQFSQGVFRLTQTKETGLTTATLVDEKPSVCRERNISVFSKRPSKKLLDELLTNGHGKFRSRGRHAAAAAHGTRWLLADRCDGTYIHVYSDVVSVRDFVRHTTILVRAGHSYLARPR